jgi:hypothetical protein
MIVVGVLLVSLLLVAVALAPLEWTVELSRPFWFKTVLYVTWFAVWMIALPAYILYKLGWVA